MDSFENCIQSISSFVLVKTNDNSLTNLYSSFSLDQFLSLPKDQSIDLTSLSYNDSINKSCFKGIENFHNKIFLFRKNLTTFKTSFSVN